MVVDALWACGVEVRLDDHADIFAVIDKELVLCLADVGEANGVGVGCSVALHLGEVEWHVGHVPCVSPTFDKGFHPSGVDSAVVAVAGSLAPDGAADGVGDDRVDFAVEELGRAAPHAGDAGEVRALRDFAAGACDFSGFVLPFIEVGVVFFVSSASLLGEWVGIVHELGVALEIGMGFDGLSLGECLDASVAVGAEEDTDGDVEFLVEFVGKRE